MRKLTAAIMGAAFIAGAWSTMTLAKSGPGRCGENMYFSAKLHKCVDARDKAG